MNSQVAASPSVAVLDGSSCMIGPSSWQSDSHLYERPPEGACHATVIPSRKHAFPSDHASETGLGPISSALRNHVRSPGAVVFCLCPLMLALRLTLVHGCTTKPPWMDRHVVMLLAKHGQATDRRAVVHGLHSEAGHQQQLSRSSALTTSFIYAERPVRGVRHNGMLAQHYQRG